MFDMYEHKLSANEEVGCISRVSWPLLVIIDFQFECAVQRSTLAWPLSPPAAVQRYHLGQLPGSSINVSHCDRLSAGLSPHWRPSVSDRAAPACQAWSLSSC